MMHTGKVNGWSLAAAVIAVAAGFGGCKSRPQSHGSSSALPAVSTTTAKAAKDVEQAASTIEQHATAIDAAAPELHADTKPILAEVARLNVTSADLQQASALAVTASKEQADLVEQVAAQAKRIEDLQNDKSSLLARLLAFGAVAGLGLAVVGGVWLRSVNAVLTGLGVFAVCVAGQWIMAYRAVIAIVGMSLVAVVAGWVIIRERKAASQIVTTVEAGKFAIKDWSAFKAVADSIQGKYAKALVNQVQRAIGSRKP
jgi:hypothetical protein